MSLTMRPTVRNAIIATVLGLVLHIFYRVFADSALGFVLAGAGAVAFVYATWAMTRAKGYHPAWALLGLLSILGPVILFALPSRRLGTAEVKREAQALTDDAKARLKDLERAAAS